MISWDFMGFFNGDLMVIEWDFGGDLISDKLHSPCDLW